MNYRIAIIGSREAIEGFSLLGVETVPASSPAEAVEKIKEMKREKGTREIEKGNEKVYPSPLSPFPSPFAIIFVTEDLAQGFSADDEKYFAKDPLPAIIPLPSHLGSTGYSMARLSRIVERAVGSDILK